MKTFYAISLVLIFQGFPWLNPEILTLYET